ncbi:MAG: uncharacterized protein JWQ35_861 [Bacteriovoracaceae bacterium]|nr:uncharacterized protein [Bacteriovoracaceae bacterium]
MFKEFRRLFIVGVFSTAPLALTIYLIVQMLRWFDSIFQPILWRLLPFYTKPVPGLGIIIGIMFILIVGLVAPSLIGKQILAVLERIVDRLPLAKLIYSSTKQIFDSFSQSGLTKFNRVVLIAFPHAESSSIGFVTQEIEAGVIPGTSGRQLSVFVPTTPNPTSGFLMIVPENKAVSLDISAEEALKLIISCGIVRGSFSHLAKHP